MRGARLSHLSYVSRSRPTVREVDVDDVDAEAELSGVGVVVAGVDNGVVDENDRPNDDDDDGRAEKAKRPGRRRTTIVSRRCNVAALDRVGS